ncbi:hypothetical protein V6N13_054242 [Hibiscus sabdariffa]|uniref:Uncharacterized protein n=1 Tax=Hibiscus sabdariffa TaxID=183260 RepID=A0ABR2DYE9_9ROSI
MELLVQLFCPISQDNLLVNWQGQKPESFAVLAVDIRNWKPGRRMGELFSLCYSDTLLLRFRIGDSDEDVVFKFCSLPNSGTNVGCLGSCDERIQAVRGKFKPLALDPVSGDSVIIWTPHLIFCYYYKSNHLIRMRCSDALVDALIKHPPPADAFVVTRCLAVL